ncbi:MAG TPA: polysaccharide deacetylase family protein [Aromatoleum sp.]|uniref:polysaccharide deacetylase family protein n=1 Tax=Aromatoleum sp. TaxID=2307007 RepID=UPI002B49F80E|nr:polysaccharide deacetylase family protein [Aromatoleum sp.]HJV26275.1 polysaccharide deacetylase family protein [Aromatoleum sp.]
MVDPISRLIHRRSRHDYAVILMYHSVAASPGKPSWPWAVSLQQFGSQLDFLAAEGWTTLTMGELAAMGNGYPERTVVVTFDDGYGDNVAAWEALTRRGMRASWFIVTSSIGQEPQWSDEGQPSGQMLSANVLREMAASGMEVGSHTVTHARLPQLDDRHLDDEVSNSKAALEDMLGREVQSFAYPYGLFDERCEEAVRRAGYRAACTTRTGWALRDRNPMQLRRLSIFNSDTPSSLARKLSFGSNDASWRDVAQYAMRRAMA